MKNEILVATNGFEGTWPAVEYSAWVAEAIGAGIRLLAVAEGAMDGASKSQVALADVVGRAETLYRSRGLHFSVERQSGRCEDLVPRAARGVDGITILGPFGRPLLKRLLTGRSIRDLLEHILTPVLYVPRACLPLKRMLICLGGLGYEITAEHLALRLGAAAGAEARLLHVAPPVDLDYPTARIERERWRDLESTDTLVGRNLRTALEAARAAGMPASITARQGNVVEEIMAEIKGGNYDLVCMGSPHGFSSLRHLYEPNVTDEVAELAICPILTARYAPTVQT